MKITKYLQMQAKNTQISKEKHLYISVSYKKGV